MFRTLNTKLSVVLVALLCLVTGMYAAVTLYTSQFYFQEVGQRLNRTLAENLIADRRLSIRDGLFDGQAVEEIFHTYMVINPAIEVYLLDARGGLLAYSAPSDKIRLKRIDLGPVRDFLHDAESGLVLGDDPATQETESPFPRRQSALNSIQRDTCTWYWRENSSDPPRTCCEAATSFSWGSGHSPPAWFSVSSPASSFSIS